MVRCFGEMEPHAGVFGTEIIFIFRMLQSDRTTQPLYTYDDINSPHAVNARSCEIGTDTVFKDISSCKMLLLPLPVCIRIALFTGPHFGQDVGDSAQPHPGFLSTAVVVLFSMQFILRIIV